MREHQRYFPVYKNGKLTNKFVFVSNALTDDFSQIILGNERVLRARLSDALFFHDNDLKRGLTTEGLNEIVFVKGLGTMQDKINRELQIAKFLGKQYNCEKMELLERAVSIAKADLTTEMVYEFTELQGIMGGYYAKQLGEAPEVVTAIYEQYFPNSENGELPSTVLSAIVAISYKLDLLFALFSIGHIPTGSRDPFGLRRAVNGILRIVLKHNLKFNFDEVLDNLVENYKQIDRKILKKFISERIINFYKDINPSIIKSVLEVENEILNIDAKIKAVTKFVEKDDFAENLSTFKRVANILKGIKNKVEVNPELFLDDAEKELYNYFQEIQAKNTQTFEEKLNDLFSIKPHLDNFFNKVMVNVEDKKIRQNRIALINIIYQEFLKISDIVKITV
jgi:glycyl-tRNA synthetase beta chain